MEKYSFPCGCSFDIISNDEKGLRIVINPDIEAVPLNCSRTWELYGRGDCKGCFQLEKQGRNAKKLQPENIEQLAGLISIIRPGCTEAFIDGKSITQHYIDRRHGREQVTYYHPSLENALKSTYGLLVYQEQAVQIVKDVANFSLQEGEMLRKAIGKKKPEIMAQAKELFLNKAREVKIVNEEEAEEIFGWIEKSQRYSFNKSHAVAYAFNSYLSAYCKAHFQRFFFTSYLYHSQGNGQKEEMKELINNAKSLSIPVTVPDFRKILTTSTVIGLDPAKRFMLRDKVISVGFTDIKGVGEKAIDRLIENVRKVEGEIGREYQLFNTVDLLLYCFDGINKTVVKALIEVGCFDYLSISRNTLLHHYDMIQELTDKEVLGIKAAYAKNGYEGDLVGLLNIALSTKPGRGHIISSKNRVGIISDIRDTIVSPPRSLDDTPAWISGIEESLMGIPITCTKVDGRDKGAANCTCQEFAYSSEAYFLVAAQIMNVKEIKTKNGKNPGQTMAFISISDTSGALEAVAFHEAWEEFKGLLISGNTVLVGGEKGRDNTLVVKKVHQI